MSEEPLDIFEGLEIHVIAPDKDFFDLLGPRIYLNRTMKHIKIGLGHTNRKVDLVLLGDVTEEDIKQEKIKAMEGEVLE
jgi:hypothetical protein